MVDSRLLTLSSPRPATMRSQALRELLGIVGAEIGAYYTVVEHEGQWRYASTCVVGDDGARARLQWLEGVPVPPGAAPATDEKSLTLRRGNWTLARPPASARNAFVAWAADIYPERVRQLPVFNKFYGPLEVVDQIRALCYEGNVFSGWVGLLRLRGSRAFGRREVVRANRSIENVRAALLAAQGMAGLESASGAPVVLFRRDGKISLASAAAAQWLDNDRMALLGRHVRQLDGPGGQARIVLDGATVCFVRLDGPDGLGYLATLAPIEPLRLAPDAELAPRQREVSELVVAGATVAECAQALGMSVYTVRSHLKEIYRRLGVASRLELAERLATPGLPVSSSPVSRTGKP